MFWVELELHKCNFEVELELNWNWKNVSDPKSGVLFDVTKSIFFWFNHILFAV
jgi:hypothetical protein